MRKTLQQPHISLFRVISHQDKTFRTDQLGRIDVARVNRLKVVYVDDCSRPNSSQFGVDRTRFSEETSVPRQGAQLHPSTTTLKADIASRSGRQPVGTAKALSEDTLSYTRQQPNGPTASLYTPSALSSGQ